MKVLGLALAVLAVVLLAQPSSARRPAAPPATLPASAEVQAAARAAADEYGVPLLFLYAVLWVESRYEAKARGKWHGGNCQRFADSYATWKGRTIGTSSKRWRDLFPTADLWASLGAAQVMPYHLWGVTLAATAPLAAGFELGPNVRAGAKVLRDGYAKGKSWIKALAVYNSKDEFKRRVLRAYRELGGTMAALEGGNA